MTSETKARKALKKSLNNHFSPNDQERIEWAIDSATADTYTWNFFLGSLKVEMVYGHYTGAVTVVKSKKEVPWPEWISNEDNDGKHTEIEKVDNHRGVDIYRVNSASGNDSWFELNAEEHEREHFISVNEAKRGMENWIEAMIT
jgi:hypothetical protein